MIAVPAEPEKPDMNSRRASVGAMYSELWASSLGTTGRDVSQHFWVHVKLCHTVDVYLVLLHELSEVG